MCFILLVSVKSMHVHWNLCNVINDICLKRTGSFDELEEFIYIFEDKIPHEENIYKNISSVASIFGILNDRGIKLNQKDIMRNLLISKIKDDDKKKSYFVRINNMFKTLNESFQSGHKENPIKLLCGMASDTFQEDEEIMKTYEEILKDDAEAGFKKMEKCCDMIRKIHNEAKMCKWGEIYMSEFIWDLFHFIIVPVYKVLMDAKKEKDFDAIMEVIIAYQLRTITHPRLFNNVRKTLAELANDIWKQKYDKDKIIRKIQVILGDMMKKKYDDYKDVLLIMNMNNNNARKILVYLELKSRTDCMKMLKNKIDVEHIRSKSSKNKYVNRLGNLTLLESGISDNGHKGNRSIQNIEFSQKAKCYSKSAILMTKKIGKEYKEWNEKDILERTKAMIKDIIKYTNKVLDNTQISENSDPESESDSISEESSSDSDVESTSDSSSESESEKVVKKPTKKVITKNK